MTAPRVHEIAVSMLVVLLLAALLSSPATAQVDEGSVDGVDPDTESVVDSDVSDTVTIAKTDDALTNDEIATRLSEVTFEEGSSTRVLIGRDDAFADAIASAVMQDSAPLLLVPRELPLPDRVVDEIQRLGATEAIMLGGELALSAEIADAIADLGLAVERRQGLSRFETAIDIAVQDAGAADTVILARAFPLEGATDPTQAFADSIAAGGMSAASGWPILLTETDRLTGPTRDYLDTAGVSNVLVVGGTAAVSETVVGELQSMDVVVERIAGPSRAATAVAIAEKRGEDSAASVATRSILVDGSDPQAWAAGFAAAAHSAAFDAPILLAAGDDLPPETAEWLGTTQDGTPLEGSEAPVLTCATRPAACERARETLQLPPPMRMTVAPADGSEVLPGQRIGVQVAGTDVEGLPVRVGGDCAVGMSGALDADGRAVTTIQRDAPAGPCRIAWQVSTPGGTVQTATATYAVPGETDALQAAFASMPRQAVAGSPVEFTDRSTGDVVAWRWAFGDGTGSDAQNPRHTYREPGEYRVVLDVVDADRQTSRVGRLITVVEEGTLAADFAFSPTSPFAGDGVAFTDRSVGEVVSWRWAFGDGAGSDAQNPRHTYREPGSYRVGLEVADRSGATARTSRTVVVEEPVQALTADFSFSPRSPEVGQGVTFTDQSTGEVVSWEWVLDESNRVTSTAQNPRHTYSTAGDYRVGLRVTDRSGATATTSAVVTVIEAPVEVVPPKAGFIHEVVGCTVNVVDITSEGSAPIASREWAFGDRGTASGPLASHTYRADGQYTIRLRATAEDGGVDTAEQPVTIQNRCS